DVHDGGGGGGPAHGDPGPLHPAADDRPGGGLPADRQGGRRVVLRLTGPDATRGSRPRHWPAPSRAVAVDKGAKEAATPGRYPPRRCPKRAFRGLRTGPVAFRSMFEDRIARARSRMEELGVDVLLLSVGADLPYFTGYTAM